MLELSEKKRQIIYEKKGHFIVRACPGSGKTFTVAARFARLLKDWKSNHQGIAVLSFTNVAWEEIQQFLEKDDRLVREFGKHTPITYPHFLGTIDSFLNQHIFLPFGHLVMKCNARPDFHGPPHNNFEPIGNLIWWGKGNSDCHGCGGLNNFSYDDKGNVFCCAGDPKKKAHSQKCKKPFRVCNQRKKELNELGWATQLDANYFALKILQDYPVIAKALLRRFPFFLIDEAQDSSMIQMMILDILIENGLLEVMLVGDPDQAIYEWRTARPELFTKKYYEWRENSIEINENWRSTKSICKFADRISSLEKPMVARKALELSKWDRSPRILGYESERTLPEIVSEFVTECKTEAIDEEDVYVLSRSNNIWNEALPNSIPLPQKDLFPWKANDEENRGIAHRMAKSKFLYDKKEFKEAFYQLEKTLCALLKGVKVVRKADLDEIINERGGFVKWRSNIYKFLTLLPRTDCVLSEWIVKANKVLESIDWMPNFEFSIISQGKYKDIYPILSFEQLFVDPKIVNRGIECSFGTVHSVKGETLEAVLFILRTKPHQSKEYPKLLEEEKLSSNEELRVVYVAITRAAKVLVLAVPEKHKQDWKKKFYG